MAGAVQVLRGGGSPSPESEGDPELGDAVRHEAPEGPTPNSCQTEAPRTADITPQLRSVPTGARGGALSAVAEGDVDSEEESLLHHVEQMRAQRDLKRRAGFPIDQQPKRNRTQEQAAVSDELAEPMSLEQTSQGTLSECSAWVDCVPAEANQDWTVMEDVCSLRLADGVMKLPRSVHSRLYEYQRHSITWMWSLFHKDGGGILADEMGLGKTVQCAAFLASLSFSGQGSRFLIVTPVSLLDQWRRELNTWTTDSGIAVHLLHGSLYERQVALRGFGERRGALLVSYDLLRNLIGCLRTAGLAGTAALAPKRRRRQDKRGCRDDDSPSEGDEPALPPERPDEDLNAPWDMVIVDEGHYIKNPSCQAGKALRRLVARSRFLLTGTPVQNKLGDLWALMDFVQPSLLGNHATFEKNFSEQIAKGSKRNASRFAVELKDQLVRELRRLTAPHFLRRLKSEVTEAATIRDAQDASAAVPHELPPKTDVVLWLSQTHAELELYKIVLNTDLVRSASGQSKCGMEALRAIALLKKLCNHPMLLLPSDELDDWRRQVSSASSLSHAGAAMAKPRLFYEICARSAAPALESATSAEEIHEQGDALECQQALPRLRALMPNSVHGGTLLSCKLRVLSVLLPQLQKRGHRCLVFSQSTRMLDLIQSCVLRALGLKFLRVDGTIDAKDRALKLAKFQQPDSQYFCMCLSVQTGGTGLTITAADRVILVDPAWNPSSDAQAIDRVHRFGQRKDVVVYRLITAGTIEDKMFRLQVFKKGVSKAYLEQEQQMRFFSQKELKQLFEPPSQAGSTQALMAEQIGSEALEHEELLNVVAGDMGGADDPDASEFWQGCHVQGFSDYQRLFMFLEKSSTGEDEDGVIQQAKRMTGRLRSEEYLKDQVVDGRWPKSYMDAHGAATASAGAQEEEEKEVEDCDRERELSQTDLDVPQS